MILKSSKNWKRILQASVFVFAIVFSISLPNMLSSRQLEARELHKSQNLTITINATGDHEEISKILSKKIQIFNNIVDFDKHAISPGSFKIIIDLSARGLKSNYYICGEIATGAEYKGKISILKNDNQIFHQSFYQRISPPHQIVICQTTPWVRTAECELENSLLSVLVQSIGVALGTESIGKLMQIEEYRAPTAIALGKIGDDHSLKTLLASLDSAQGGHRILWALGEIGDPSSIDAMIEFSKGHEDLAPFLGASLIKFEAKGFDALISAFEMGIDWHIQGIARALGKTDSRAVPYLIELLDTSAAGEAAEGLWNIGDKRAVEALINSLNKPRNNNVLDRESMFKHTLAIMRLTESLPEGSWNKEWLETHKDELPEQIQPGALARNIIKSNYSYYKEKGKVLKDRFKCHG